MSVSRGIARLAGARGGSVKSGDAMDWPWTGQPPDWFFRYGLPGSIEKAVGLPALLGALLLLSETMGSTSAIVYEGKGKEKRRAEDSWQWGLLHDRPTSEALGSMPFYADQCMNLAAAGNSYIRKYKSSRGRVVDLVTLDPREWKPRRLGGEIVFDDKTAPNRPPLGRGELIHLRRVAKSGELEGIAPVTQLRLTIQQGLARDQSASRFWENDARPSVVVKFPQEISPEQGDLFIEKFNARYGGPENKGKAAALGGGSDISTIPLSMVDAEWIASIGATRELINGVYHIPAAMNGDGKARPDPADEGRFRKFALGPYMTIIDDAFSADPDLFPPGGGMYQEMLADSLLRPDTKDRYDAYRLARQAGWMTTNEIRALENMPPVPDGDQIQVIPVGGGEPAANPAPPATPPADS